MRKNVLAALMVASLTFATTSAQATDTNGNFGLGGKLTFGGVTGMSAIYWLGQIGVEGVFGFRVAAPDGADTSFQLGLALGAHFKIHESVDTHLTIGGRLDVLAADGGAFGDDVVIGIEVPMRVEHFFSPSFALHGEMGLSMLINNGVVFTIGDVGLVGGGGFAYYFGGSGSAAQPVAQPTVQREPVRAF